MAASLRIDRGTTYTIGIEFKKDGVPASLVGAEIRFTVKDVQFDSNWTDTDALIAKNVTNHTDPTNGISVIPLDPVDTAEIPPGKYFFDIKVEEANGDIHTLLKGKCSILGSPTNRLD